MPVSKEEHRKFYASMSKTQPLGLPSIKTRRHKSPQRRSPQRLSSMSPEPQSPGSLIAKANVMASWKPVLDFEMDNCDLDSRQLDGRDYFSLLGVTPEATAPEIDIAYNRCRHEWDSSTISKNLKLAIGGKKELNEIGSKYRQMEALLKQAHTALSYTSFRHQYADHIRARDELLFANLPAWTRGLSNVIPTLPVNAMMMLRGLKIKIPTTVLLAGPGGGGHRVAFSNSRNEVRLKKEVSNSGSKLVAVLAGEDFSTDKLPGTRIVGHWQYMPNQQHVMAECTEENALQSLEGRGEGKMMLQEEVGAHAVWRSYYRLDRTMEKFEQWTEVVEDIKGVPVSHQAFQNCMHDERKMRMVEILSAHTRGAVSHLERTHDCRVLLICAQFLSNPEGAVFLSQFPKLFTCSIRPWANERPDAAWIEKHSVQHIRDNQMGDPVMPLPSGELLTEAELSSTWPLLKHPPRAGGKPPLLQTHFSVDPIRGNNWSNTIRKKPAQSVAPNFRKHSYTSYVRRKGKEQMVLNQKQHCMQQVSINAHIIRDPFNSDTFSLSVPGRFMESNAVDLTKPWEVTARTNFSQLWTAPKPKLKRQGPDPYGLEIRNLQTDTEFELEELYELYGHFFRFTKTPGGDKDREACAQPPENFVEDEFNKMLAKCGINRAEVAKRIFIQFSHIVGFGRKKRCV